LKRYTDTPHYLDATTILREAETDEKILVNCSVVTGLDAYRVLLEEKRYFDYSAIMEAAVDVLANEPSVRERLAKRVRHVIVDEYQDVNPIQEAIVWLLYNLGAHICVVGDDDNFRSSQGIVETARAFIEQNHERLSKKMQPTNAQDYEAGDIVALSFDNPEQEAAYIAQNIQALRGVAIKEPTKKESNRLRGISWSDIAILLRSARANGEPITRALDKARFPTSS
jgi:DNA helicase II / ATP-dependent DNA helicase PcrA